MLLVSSAPALGAAAVPMTPAAPTGVLAGLGVLGLTVAGLVSTVPWHGWRHLGPLTVFSGVATIVVTAATAGGTASSAVGFVWVAMHAALFFSRRLARTYVAGVAAALACALAVNPFPGAGHAWFFTVLTTSAVAEALTSTVARLHQQAADRPAHRPAEPTGPGDGGAQSARRRGPLRHRLHRADRGPRRLQGGQRPARARRR
jgi:hypothetical protein